MRAKLSCGESGQDMNIQLTQNVANMTETIRTIQVKQKAIEAFH
jgi:hypothetical protein